MLPNIVHKISKCNQMIYNVLLGNKIREVYLMNKFDSPYIVFYYTYYTYDFKCTFNFFLAYNLL